MGIYEWIESQVRDLEPLAKTVDVMSWDGKWKVNALNEEGKCVAMRELASNEKLTMNELTKLMDNAMVKNIIV